MDPNGQPFGQHEEIEVAVPLRPNQPLVRRLLGALARRGRPSDAAPTGAPMPDAPSFEAPAPDRPEPIVPTVEGALAREREPGWHEVLSVGRAVSVAWTLVGGPRGGQSFDARATVRTALGDDAWLWFEQDVAPHLVPPAGQAVVLRVSRPDGLRLVPARVIEDSRGGSLLVAISGRVVRLQRRDYVRAAVDLPPQSAIRLTPNGVPLGVLGVRLIDVSGGGVQLASAEPLERRELLRLNLRLDDDGPPIPSTVAILERLASDPREPARARGIFGELAEQERTRIIQYVYRLELAARKQSVE